MATAGLVLGIFCTFGMMTGMVPFLGWINWFNLPLAFIALCLSGAALVSGGQDGSGRSKALAGVILAIVAIGFGGIRWVLGGFIL
jgi:hypothetical protein